MPSEGQLQHRYQQLTTVLDPEGATTLMDIVSPIARNELATKSDLLATRADIADLRAEMNELSGSLRAEMAGLKGELRAEMHELRGELRAEMAGLKHDLTRSFASWLFISQGVMVAIVGLLVSLA